jgi:hypothetical protein
MSSFFEKLNEGGPFFTYPIIVFLIIIIALFVKGYIRKDNNSNKKIISLIASIAWFAVAWGFLGRTFGLIVAFDNIAAAGELTPPLMAEGLKMAILNPLLGISVFLIARLGIIILTLLQKENVAAVEAV